MFQFTGSGSLSGAMITHSGLPHSDIRVSLPACGSTRLFAAYRVLLRLETPRHPPYALLRLTFAFLRVHSLDVYARGVTDRAASAISTRLAAPGVVVAA